MAIRRPAYRVPAGGGVHDFADDDVLFLPAGFVTEEEGDPVEGDDIVLYSQAFEGDALAETLKYARLPTGSGSWDVGAGNTLTLTRAVSLGSTLTVAGTSTLTGDVIVGPASTTSGTIHRGRNDSRVEIAGGNATATGMNILLDGPSAGTPNVFRWRVGSTQIGRFSADGVLILGPGSAAGSALPGGIRVPGASQFDAETFFGHRITFTGNQGSVPGAILKSSGGGLLIRGITGSINDLQLVAANGAGVIDVPTGTNNLKLASLAGTGTRNVVVDANGVLSAP